MPKINKKKSSGLRLAARGPGSHISHTQFEVVFAGKVETE